MLLEEPRGRSRDWSQACSTWPQQVRLSRGYIDRRRSTRVCGRSCVRGFCLLPCCGAKLVPLPLSRAGSLGCGRGGAAQGRRRAGTVVRGRRSPSDGGGRARRAHHPLPNGRRRAHGRAEFPRPLFAALPPVGARGRVRGRLVRVPRPTAARGESEPRPPPGLQSDLGGLGPRAAVSPAFPARRLPPARPQSLPSPGEGLQFGPDPRRLLFWGGATRKRDEGFSTREAEVQRFGFAGS